MSKHVIHRGLFIFFVVFVLPSWSRGKLPRSGGAAENVVKLGGRPKLILEYDCGCGQNVVSGKKSVGDGEKGLCSCQTQEMFEGLNAFQKSTSRSRQRRVRADPLGRPQSQKKDSLSRRDCL
jgi:hypothetical protein